MRRTSSLILHKIIDLIRTERLLPVIKDGDDTITADVQGAPVIIKGNHHFPAWFATGLRQFQNLATILAATTGDFPAHRLTLF